MTTGYSVVCIFWTLYIFVPLLDTYLYLVYERSTRAEKSRQQMCLKTPDRFCLIGFILTWSPPSIYVSKYMKLSMKRDDTKDTECRTMMQDRQKNIMNNKCM